VAAVKSIAEAMLEAQALAAQRDWQMPTKATQAEAQRLLDLVSVEWPAPEVQAHANGTITLDWEAGGDAGTRGWLTLTVVGQHTLEHAAVIDGDEYGLTEDFTDVLPGWANELLRRLHQAPELSPERVLQ
jgi:hypothetical protein